MIYTFFPGLDIYQTYCNFDWNPIQVKNINPPVKFAAIMKKIILLLFLTAFSVVTGILRSQNPGISDDVSYINSLLKANPYTDTFLEITFYYTIEITPASELVVNMDFDGPFSSSFKSRITDLDRNLRIDTALEGTSSICWSCKPDTTMKAGNCVYFENTTKDGEKDFHYTDNICVMISRKSDIRNKLIEAFNRLFGEVLEQ